MTALPYNVTLIESVHQKAKEVTTFVKGRYDAYVAGGIELHKYTETYALEDLDLLLQLNNLRMVVLRMRLQQQFGRLVLQTQL